MQGPTRALIDGDIIPYEFGSITAPDGSHLSWPYVVSRVSSRIEGILTATGCKDYTIYMSKEGGYNFRNDMATILPYKGTRSSEKGHWWKDIRTYLIKVKGAIEVDGYEADDKLAMELSEDPEGSVLCSRDKDLLMVPGWHYIWQAGKQKEKANWYQTEIEGMRAFFKQLLTGDRVDNIPGLYSVGDRSSCVKSVLACDSVSDMYRIIRLEYTRRFGSYWRQFLNENAVLLWMLQYEPEDEGPHNQAILVMNAFEDAYQNEEKAQQFDI